MNDPLSTLRFFIRQQFHYSLFRRETDRESNDISVELTTDIQNPISLPQNTQIINEDQNCACE